MPEEIIKRDLGKLLLKLEGLQEASIQAALAPKNPTPTLSAEDELAALNLLRAPNLVERIEADLTRCGVVGESYNLLAGYLAAVSRKLDQPLAVLIQSSSAAGKSSLMDAVLNLMPEEERIQYSAMTGQSLFYLGETDLQHKILAIAEKADNNLNITSAANQSQYYSKTKKVTAREEHSSQVASTLSADGNVALTARQDLTVKASEVKAGQDAYLYAGNNLNLLADTNSDYSLYDMKKKGSFGAKQTQRDEVSDTTHVGTRITTGNDLQLISGGDQRYQAAQLNSGRNLTLESGGAITFEGVTDRHQESHEKSKSDLAWTSAKGKGRTDETLRQTQMVAKGEIAIRAVDGLHIDVKQVDQETVSQAIDAMVKADPQLAWLKDAERRGDVDWRQVKELHDSFKYSHSGLGAGSQLVIAIVVTYLTAGASSAAIGSAAGATAGSGSAMAAGVTATATTTAAAPGWANVALTAVTTSAASNAAISTINNRGNLGTVFKDVTSNDALRSYVVTGVTAGITADVYDKWTGTTTPVEGLFPKLSEAAAKGGLSSPAGLGRFATSQILQNSTSTLLDRALGGDSKFDSALRSSLANTFAAAGFNWVGDFAKKYNLPDGQFEKIVLHALVGGLSAEVAGGDFRTGALSAGLNEAVVGELAKQYADMAPDERKKLLVMNSQLIGVFSAAASESDAEDLQTASWVADSATSYNRLLHSQEKKLLIDEAKTLQEQQGKPRSDLSWEDLLLLAGNAEVDAYENQRLKQLVELYPEGSPEGVAFAQDLEVAQQSIQQLAAKDVVLTWNDNTTAIKANGGEVKAFQATESQFKDHGLFNTSSASTVPSGNNWAGETEIVPEAWKRQFGERNATLYLNELSQVASNPEELQEIVDRVSTISTGGIQDVTWDLDAALMVTGAPAAMRALLSKRIATRSAEKFDLATAEDLATVRAKYDIPEGDTIGVARTDIPGFEGEVIEGLSPALRRSANLPSLDELYGTDRLIKAPTKTLCLLAMRRKTY